MSRKKSVMPRVYVIIIVLILLATVPFITAMSMRYNKQRTDIRAQQTALDAKQEEADALSRKVAFAKTEAGIERMARELGYIYEGETLYRRK